MEDPAIDPHFLVDYLQSLEDTVSKFMFIPVLLVISLNVFHIFILSQKSISSSSMNSLLIGIAIVEILFPINYLKVGLREIYWKREPFECLSLESYQEIVIDWVLNAISDCFRRCSCWLGLLLAVIRTLSVRNALDKKFDFLCKSTFGWKVITITVISSTILTVSYVFRFEIREMEEIYCEGTRGLVSVFMIMEISGYSTIGNYAKQIHLFMSGIFGKLLPCFLFPAVAILLIIELRKASKLHSDVAIISEKTSKIVIYMTVIFVIIEFPIGVCKLVRVSFPGNTNLVLISRSIETLLNMIYICLTATHSMICFAMSSQYRWTVKHFFGVNGANSKVVSVIEVRMSLPIRAVSAVSILAEPITFRNGKKAPNRIMKSPLTEKLYDWTDPSISKRGIPSQAIKNIYSTWGHGGFGLIVTGMFVVDPKYISEAGQGIICEENSADNQELSVLSKALKSSGSLAIAQLSHPGSKALTDYTDSKKHVISDNLQDPITYTQHQLEEEVISRFAFAASELYKNGFDGIELLAAHGMIFNQFLSPGNQRDDDYSGSLENRARLLFDVLNAVRRAVPESTGFLVGVKLNSRDFQGSEEEKKDVIRLCELIEAAGFDFVELTGGMMEMTMPALQLRDSTVTRENYFAEFVTETSRIFEKTVIYITGGWQTADSMASSVELGLTNGVGLARWSAAEPDFPKKLLAAEINGLTPNGFPRFDFWYHKNAALWQLRSMAESPKGIPTDFTRPLECEKFAKACDEYKVKVEKIGGINNHVGVLDYAPL